MKPHLLIDGDTFGYLAALAAGTPFGISLENARRWIEAKCEKLVEGLDAEGYTLCVSHSVEGRYFRHDFLPDYKSHRTQGTPPEYLDEVKALMKGEMGCKSIPLLEADDVVGIWGSDGHEGPTIMVSEDKDLLTVPGTHFNPRTGKHVVLSVEEADYNHLLQTLTGDPCDGFKGCPNVGPVKAEKVLGGTPCWSCVVEAYAAKGLTEADALVQARCARILRASDWDEKTKRPIPWTPSSPA